MSPFSKILDLLTVFKLVECILKKNKSYNLLVEDGALRHLLDLHPLSPSPVYLLYGRKQRASSVPDSVWEDCCEYLLWAPSPTQLAHVQHKWSRDYL